MKQIKSKLIIQTGLLIVILIISSKVNAQLSFIDSGQKIGNNTDYNVELSDFDGDGDLDVIEGGSVFSIRFNDGNGLFFLKQTINGNGNMAVADLNGDNAVDLFLTGYTGDSNQVWLNDGNGLFSNTGQQLGMRDSRGIALGDLDGDGDLDAFIANHTNTTTNLDGGNQVFFNDGAGNFTNSGQELGNDWSNCVDLGDIDNDGDLDAIVVNATFKYKIGHEIWLNDGGGQFTLSNQTLDLINGTSVDLGDIDNDGDLDIYISHDDTFSQSESDLIYLNDGTGNFSNSGQKIGKEKSSSGCLYDIDKDGDLDIFVVSAHYLNPNKPNEVWLNDGKGIFSDSKLRLNIPKSSAVKLGDLDNDGDIDAYIACIGPNKVYTNNKITLGIKNKYNEHGISITPNPTTGIVRITFNTSPVRNALVEIYNLQGTQVFSKTFQNTPSATIDLTGNAAGIYVVKVIADGVSYEEKIVKE